MDIADQPIEELSKFIRATHGKLRNEYRKVQDPDAVWSQHSSNKDELERYAAAMHRVAEHWETRKSKDKDCVSRINWCYQALQTYFREGDLEKTRDKELRTATFHRPDLVGPPDTTNGIALPPDVSSIQTDGKEHSSPTPIERKTIVYGDLLKVLDVGSCYNPFSRYTDLDVTALDLQPATEDVFQCDFLKLKISVTGNSNNSLSPVVSSDKEAESSGMEATVKTAKTITTLAANSFDAIMFSFLLSYIPSPELRLRCCMNAYDLLKPEGVLVIAAADSRGVTSNGYIYKCWQITMESLGFVRVKYEKFKDFHGMVFRKGLYKEIWQTNANVELEKMKAKKKETEKALADNKGKGKRLNRREKQIESFDLDKAFLGLWLPHDFRDSKEEERVLEEDKPKAKRKRKSADSEPSQEDGESTPKASKTDCPSIEKNNESEHISGSSSKKISAGNELIQNIYSTPERNTEMDQTLYLRRNK